MKFAALFALPLKMKERQGSCEIVRFATLVSTHYKSSDNVDMRNSWVNVLMTKKLNNRLLLFFIRKLKENKRLSIGIEWQIFRRENSELKVLGNSIVEWF